MTVCKTKKYIGLLGASIGLLQGIAWVILSLMVILLYTKVWKPNFAISNEGLIRTALYLDYIFGNTNYVTLVTPSVIFSFAIIYLITSVAWIGLSVLMYLALSSGENTSSKSIFKSWGSMTLTISAADFILLVLAVVDYSRAMINDVGSPIPPGILMCIAGRGFTLWLINVALAVIIMRFSEDNDEEARADPTHVSSQNVYQQPSPSHHGNVNKAYNWDNDRPPHKQYGKPEVYPKPKANPNTQLAKIGKPPSKASPQNVPPPKLPGTSYAIPRVPSPDYSPPNSPYQSSTKPALKGRSQNMYNASNYY